MSFNYLGNILCQTCTFMCEKKFVRFGTKSLGIITYNSKQVAEKVLKCV